MEPSNSKQFTSTPAAYYAAGSTVQPKTLIERCSSVETKHDPVASPALINRRQSYNPRTNRPAFIVNNPSSWKPTKQKSSPDLWQANKTNQETSEEKGRSHHSSEFPQNNEHQGQKIPKWKKKPLAK